MTTTLEISANAKFDSVAEARIAGQAIEQFLGIKGKMVSVFTALRALKGVTVPAATLTLYTSRKVTTKITRGHQEVETRVMNLVKTFQSSRSCAPC